MASVTVAPVGGVVAAGRYLDLARRDPEYECRLQVWDCTGGADQQWKVPS
jgi:hypothetical protein